MTEIDSREMILRTAALLHNRAAFASKLDTILTVLGDERQTQVRIWAEEENKRYRSEFVSTFQRAMIRVLLSELCVIFDPSNPRHPQYSLSAVLENLGKHIEDYGHGIIQYPEEIREADLPTFCHINRQNIPVGTLTGEQTLNLISHEVEEFKRRYAAELQKIRNVRDKYLSHADSDHVSIDIGVSFLRDATDWCVGITNLILQVMVQSGARAYMEHTRLQIEQFTKEDYYRLVEEIC
jgi:hypothetical protein